MNAEAAADTAVLVSAILMLLAIASKLITANLVTRSKRVYAKLDVSRREISSRLKEAQLKRTSARGTLEFWERRRTETAQRVQDASRDLENYAAQFSDTLDDDDVAVDEADMADSDEGLLEELPADAGEALSESGAEAGMTASDDDEPVSGVEAARPAGDGPDSPEPPQR